VKEETESDDEDRGLELGVELGPLGAVKKEEGHKERMLAKKRSRRRRRLLALLPMRRRSSTKRSLEGCGEQESPRFRYCSD